MDKVFHEKVLKMIFVVCIHNRKANKKISFAEHYLEYVFNIWYVARWLVVCTTLSKLIITRCIYEWLCWLSFAQLLVHTTGPYFTPIDLANFAQELDDAEREKMAEGDTTSAEYLRFLQVLFYTEQIAYRIMPLLSNHLLMWMIVGSFQCK